MTKVTLVRYLSGFQNVSDKFRIYEGELIDETCQSVEVYILPKGFVQGEMFDGLPGIYDEKDHYYDICEDSEGRPQLIANSDLDSPVLRRTA